MHTVVAALVIAVSTGAASAAEADFNAGWLFHRGDRRHRLVTPA